MLAGQRRAAVLRRSAPAGFARNGAANAATKTMLARVKAGAGRGRIVWKGDSTLVGQGGGSGAPYYLGGARAVRPAAVAAAALTAAGVPALDQTVTGDNGMNVAAGFTLPAYDPRVGANVQATVPSGSTWGVSGGLGFAGGNYLSNAGDGTPLSFAFADADTFEIVYYNSAPGTIGFTIDGAAPASGPASVAVANSGGFSRATVGAAASGTVRLASPSVDLAIRSVTGYRGGRAAIDMIVHAALGASSANQAAAGNWLNNDALGFDAPDLTIVALGYNDQAAGVSAGAFAGSVQSIVTKARVSGDVLLVAQPPAGGGYNADAAAYRDAILALGRSNGVATLNLYDAFGGSFTGELAARMADGAVHPTAELYAQIGAAYARAILTMGR